MGWVHVGWSRTPEPGAARDLVRAVVATRLDRQADTLTLHRLCPRCGSEGHGRPFLGGWAGRGVPSISLARTTGATVVAVASGEVGVDVEAGDRFTDLALAAVLLHPDERATTTSGLAATWVRKEAVLKALGHGLAVDPRLVRVEPGAGQAVVGPPATGERCWVDDLALAPGLHTALAGRGVRPDHVTVLEVAPGALPAAASGRRGRPAADRS